jgi:Sec-independent protein translocase protein TatA
MALSVRTIQSLETGKSTSHNLGKGGGSLSARALNDGRVTFYFRYTNSSGKRERIALGLFSPRKTKGRLTLDQAMEQADKLSRRFRDGDKDLKAALEQESRQREEQRKAEAKQAARDAQRATLGNVLTAYCDHLDELKKASAPKVRGTLQRHVRDSWPAIWNEKASDLDIGELIPIIAKVSHAGKSREAAKLRAYIRAAFTIAMQAKQNPSALPSMVALNIITNPAADIAPIDAVTEDRQRNLSQAELQSYWKRISKLAAPFGSLLRFHLLTGGQRVTQLSRLKTENYDPSAHIISLRDGKGRRKKARIHDIPLLPDAVISLNEMQGGTLGPYIYTLNAGESGTSYDMTRKQLFEICAAMLKDGELEHGTFTLGDIRRTVETRLAAAGVAPYIRAQLQSHGISGVQTKHYDRHDYMPEKRRALETLYRIVTGNTGEVVNASFG